MSQDYLFTSESVTEGHPDKLADQISDAVLDAILTEDSQGRVACETLVTTGLAVIAGEITTTATPNLQEIARGVIADTGYTDASYGFDAEHSAVLITLDKQSPDIAMGVNPGGAGDQGIMFGYACTETPELMPLPITLAHQLTHRLAQVRKESILDFIRPDGKSQVTVEYVDNKPTCVTTVVISSQHHPDVADSDLKDGIIEEVINKVIPDNLKSSDIIYHINPTGRFVTGGPHGDAGLTGRKIIVDTYGGMGRHGGGALSGKDPTKVDRSATYAARHAAKNLVAVGLADRCEIQIAYAIGRKAPVSVMVDTFGTGDDEKAAKLVNQHFDLTPEGIIERLKLRKPIYRNTAAYGHFGRNEPGFTWEKTDYIDQLKD